MYNLTTMNESGLLKLHDVYMNEYENFKSKNIKLDMSRGKPSKEQLDLSLPLLDILSNDSNFISDSGIDSRNYGHLDGLPEMKKFISEVTGISPENFIVGGNSSLSMMFDTISCYMIHGVCNNTPWLKQEKIKFLCPAPGYDRHFSMCEHFGIEMITVKMNNDGPDMDFIEEIVSQDSSIKGIWCVPKYSNPQGITYSDEVIRRLAALKPAATDFRIFWDNAYFVHDLTDNSPTILDILSECEKNGNENLPIMFFSTSKITFAGAGITFLACAEDNLKQLKKNYSFKTVGFNKINQLSHLRFLKNKNNLYDHMKRHRDIIKPKFDIILETLNKEFKDNPILSWNNPKGGYFVSVDTKPGCAKEVVRLCKEAGVTLTPAGATYPYGNDPADSNIRLAPTFPSIDELKSAIDIFCLVVKIVYIKNRLSIE